MTDTPSPAALERLASFPRDNLPLAREVRIDWNEYAVPFIHAQDDLDLAFALGLVHAHLRLVQLEILRKVSQGRLSEMFGPLTREVDAAIRTLELGRASGAIEAQMPAETKAFMARFVDGLNHYRSHGALPREFSLLKLGEQHWKISDLITISRLAGADVNWFVWYQMLPLLNEPAFPAFWRRIREVHGGSMPSLLPSSSALAQFSRSGSNAFAISGKMTASGKPLIAADPHVGLQLPNLWLLAGVSSASLRATGLMFPGLPVFLIGRNERIAWGATNMRSMSSSLFETPEDAGLTSEEELIRVRLWRPRKIVRMRSDWGTLVSELPQIRRHYEGPPLSLHWVGHQPSDEITSFFRVNRAQDWNSFREAFATYAVSGQNYIFADIEGNIGQLMAVRLPLAGTDYNKSFITPAGSTWRGTIGCGELPFAFNPEAGFLVSANNTPLPSGHAADFKVGIVFSSNDRFERITRLIAEGAPRHDLASVEAIQIDTSPPSCLRLKARILQIADTLADRSSSGAELSSKSHEVDEVIDRIRNWDGFYRQDSRGAVAFEILEYNLARRLYSRSYGDKIAASLIGSDVVHDMLEKDLGRWQTRLDEVQMGIWRESLEATGLRVKFYKNWGDFHRVKLAHFLARIPVIGKQYVFGDLEADGTSNSVLKTYNGLTDERHDASYGTNARFISDLSSLDDNYAVLLGGQDGFVSSRNFLDQVPLWKAGRYLKLPLTLDGVRNCSVHSITLRP